MRGTDLESREASLYLLAKLCTGVLNVPVTTYICLLTLKFIIYKWNALLRLIMIMILFLFFILFTLNQVMDPSEADVFFVPASSENYTSINPEEPRLGAADARYN